MPKQLFAMCMIGVSAASGRAWADPLPKELTSACGDQVKGAKKATLLGHHVSEVDYQVWLPKGRALVSIVGGGPDDPCGGGPQCTVFPVGKASAKLTAKAGASGASVKAFVMPAASCTEDACPSVLAIRAPDKEEQVIDAIAVPDGCTPVLAAVALVPGQDSIHLTCSRPSGAGDTEMGILFHVVDGHLTHLLSFESGTTETASPDEAAAGACTIRPVGAATVAKAGGVTVLRVTRAPDGGQSTADGAGPACKHQRAIEQDYTWDAKTHELVESGPGRPVVRDTCACPKR
jgi:hypothetical protein